VFMNFLWGSLMAFMGLFMFVSAMRKSNFVLYRLMYSRVKLLWGDYAHTFLAISGLIITGLSALFFFGIWG